MNEMELYLTAPKPWIDQIISVAREQKKAEILSMELDEILDTISSNGIERVIYRSTLPTWAKNS